MIISFSKTFKPLIFSLFCLFSFGLQAQNRNIAFRSKLEFPGQTCANICGYAAAGREYALVGASKGMIIVDVTKPDMPVQITQIPGPDNLWKEIKTYRNYAYITSEGGGGVQIVDLSALPSPTLSSKFYTGDGAILNQLGSIHALHIDTVKAFLYAYGSKLFSGGAVVLNLKPDPFNPVFAGAYSDNGYIHDGWVENDTLYACHIGRGFFSVVDMKDKSKPKSLNTQSTPNTFPHNTWMSKNRKVIYTTDEVDDSFLAAYDVSDPTDIKPLDRIQSNPGSNSVVHNTHIRGDYAVTSWYTDGVTIVDASRPNNLVQVGNFDTAPEIGGGGYEGCWGVYPFLPSGTLVASVIEGKTSKSGELWVLSPTYTRAAYLEGVVTDAKTGQTLNNALIEIVNSAPVRSKSSGLDGRYGLGQAEGGTISVKVSKPGYLPFTATATLSAGNVTVLDAPLQPIPAFVVGGQIFESAAAKPVAGAKIALDGGGLRYEATSDAQGKFSFPGVPGGIYNLVAGAWGYQYVVRNNQNLGANRDFNLLLDKGFRDDFVFDYGWQKSGTAQTGAWVRAEPLGIAAGGIQFVPEQDVPGDIGDQCYVTGNSSSELDADDVESGTAILMSPPMDLSGYTDPVFKGELFYTGAGFGQPSKDSIRIFIDNGTVEKQLFALSGSTYKWQSLSRNLKPLIALSKTMRIKIVCDDDPAVQGSDTDEAAFDFFRIVEGAGTAVQDPLEGARLAVRPNPFHSEALLDFEMPGGGRGRIAVYDLTGRLAETVETDGEAGQVTLGSGLNPGVYIVRLEQDGRASRNIKLVKVNGL
jgi:choice-of-anchor B domain-containing protein